jgi:hypothetical protein
LKYETSFVSIYERAVRKNGQWTQWVFGASSKRIFTVNIAKTKNVDALKESDQAQGQPGIK